MRRLDFTEPAMKLRPAPEYLLEVCGCYSPDTCICGLSGQPSLAQSFPYVHPSHLHTQYKMKPHVQPETIQIARNGHMRRSSRTPEPKARPSAYAADFPVDRDFDKIELHRQKLYMEEELMRKAIENERIKQEYEDHIRLDHTEMVRREREEEQKRMLHENRLRHSLEEQQHLKEINNQLGETVEKLRINAEEREKELINKAKHVSKDLSERLQRAIYEKEEFRSDMVALAKELEVTKSFIADKEKLFVACKNERDELQASVERLQHSYTNAVKRSEEFENHSKSANLQLYELKDRDKLKTEMIDDLQSEVTSLRKKVDFLEEDSQKRQYAIETAKEIDRQEFERLLDELDELKDKLSDSLKKNKELTSYTKDLETDLVVKKSKIDALENTAQSNTDQIKHLNDVISKLEDEIQAMKRDKQSIARNLKDKEIETSAKSRNLQEIDTDLNIMKRKLKDCNEQIETKNEEIDKLRVAYGRLLAKTKNMDLASSGEYSLPADFLRTPDYANLGRTYPAPTKSYSPYGDYNGYKYVKKSSGSPKRNYDGKDDKVAEVYVLKDSYSNSYQEGQAYGLTKSGKKYMEMYGVRNAYERHTSDYSDSTSYKYGKNGKFIVTVDDGRSPPRVLVDKDAYVKGKENRGASPPRTVKPAAQPTPKSTTPVATNVNSLPKKPVAVPSIKSNIPTERSANILSQIQSKRTDAAPSDMSDMNIPRYRRSNSSLQIKLEKAGEAPHNYALPANIEAWADDVDKLKDALAKKRNETEKQFQDLLNNDQPGNQPYDPNYDPSNPINVHDYGDPADPNTQPYADGGYDPNAQPPPYTDPNAYADDYNPPGENYDAYADPNQQNPPPRFEDMNEYYHDANQDGQYPPQDPYAPPPGNNQYNPQNDY
jgi:hypothetical protein